MTKDKTSNFRVPAQELTDRVDRSRSHLYVINTWAKTDRSTMTSRRAEHIEYLHGLAQSGDLAGAGPVLSDDAAYYDGHGLIIVRAASVSRAIEIAAADPFHSGDIRSFTVTPWLLSEGILYDALQSGTDKLTAAEQQSIGDE